MIKATDKRVIDPVKKGNAKGRGITIIFRVYLRVAVRENQVSGSYQERSWRGLKIAKNEQS